MTKQTLSVTEMFSSIMELLEQAGYAKHTLWGSMYGSIRSVVSFYHEKGICDYDPAVTLEFLQTVERRYRDGEICREYYNAQKRAARKFEMFHATGTLTWECTKRTSKYQLNEEIIIMSKIIGKWRNTWKCALCGEEHEGWGSNPAPLLDCNSALVCPECNQIVVAFRMLLIRMGEDNGYKTIDRSMYGKIKKYAKKHPAARPYAEFLDGYFKNPLINKITDPINYGDLVEEDELDDIA